MTGLLKRISSEILDSVLSDEELSIIADEVLDWRDKAFCLGLCEADIENIREDNKNSNKMQKLAMLREWKKRSGDKATLRGLIQICRRHNWIKFAHRLCRKLGHISETKGKTSP